MKTFRSIIQSSLLVAGLFFAASTLSAENESYRSLSTISYSSFDTDGGRSSTILADSA